jgi:nicotinate dehydrogenase subunit B
MAEIDPARHDLVSGWMEFTETGRVLVRTGKVDIGQRISTALALVAAEELDVDWRKIDVARADTSLAPDEGITSGSNSLEESGTAIRQVAATVRREALRLAADQLEVASDALEIADGTIRPRQSNRATTYWELFGSKPLAIAIDPNAPVKQAESYRQVGSGVTPRDLEAIVGGTATFLHDMIRPGMLHGRVVRPPRLNGRLAAVPDEVVGRIAAAGGEVVRTGGFLAVAHAEEYEAIEAAALLAREARWDPGPDLDTTPMDEQLLSHERVSLPVGDDGKPIKAPVPPLEAPPEDAATTLTARYFKPYILHGSIGPSAAMALLESGRLTVWSHSQGIFVLRDRLCELTGLAEEDIRVIHVPGAGCYGHNGADDVACDAVLAARAIPGRPLLMKWTRADEHGWEPTSSAMVMQLRASLDAAGNIVTWSHETYSDTHSRRPRPGPGRTGVARLIGAREAEPELGPPPLPQPNMSAHGGVHRNLAPIYDFPGKRLVKNLVRDLPLRTSSLRTLGGTGNTFAIESFMDELALAAGIDPVAFRLKYLADPRGRDVLQEAARMLNDRPNPEGRGRGIAFGRYKNAKAYVAIGVELEVTDAVEIRLHRAVIAGDAGQVIDAGGLASQLEGGFLQAASWSLYEAVTFDIDGVTSRDWESYPILRFDNVPEIETRLIDRPGEAPLGAGEASSGPTPAAIANAVHDATGIRLYRMPFTPDAIRQAALA